jgi:hypothetical protein
MNDVFASRVRAAAVAGWWTLLVAVVFLSLQWGVYLYAMSAHPAWLASVWGPDLGWAFIQRVWLWAFVALKMAMFVAAAVVVWLTLWARQLQVQTPNGKA